MNGYTVRYTAVQRSQHITQQDERVYGRSYIANTSSCDGKAAFLNEKPQYDHVNFFQSFAKFHEQGLPTKLPAEREAAVRRSPQLVELQDRLLRLQHENANPSDTKFVKSKAQGLLKKLRRECLKQYEVEWVEQRRRWKVITRGEERPEDDIKKDLWDILCIIMPERGRLARTLISDRVVSADERRQAVQDLYSLASQDCMIIYRPGEKPVDGVCPVKGCGLQISK